jgi:hypothetical protein
VNGNRLTVHTETKVFQQNETLEKLTKAYEEDGKFRKQYGSLFYRTGDEEEGIWKLFTKSHLPGGEVVVATVVTGFTWETGPEAGKTIPGNRLVVEGLGTIFFGELVLEDNARRLTLLRLQLGLPDGVREAAAPLVHPPPPPPPPPKIGGEGAVCEAHSNGVGVPPTE